MEKTTSEVIKISDLRSNFGEVEAGGTVTVTWNYEGEDDDILLVKPGCSCTADVTWKDGVISAEYTAETYEELKRKMPNLDKAFPSGTKQVIKSLKVYVTDEHDLYTINQRGVNTPNPDKPFITINLTGTNVFKSQESK